MPPRDVENDFYRDGRRRNDNRQTVARNHMGTLVTPNGMDGTHDLPSNASISSNRPEPSSRPTSIPPSTDPRRRATVSKPSPNADGNTTSKHKITERSTSPSDISGENSTELRKVHNSSLGLLKSELIRMGELTYDKGLHTLRVAQQQRDLSGVQRELQVHANSTRQHPPLVEVLEGKVLEGNKKLQPMVLNLSASSKKASAQVESVVQAILSVLTSQVESQVKEIKDQVSLAKGKTEAHASHDLSTFVKSDNLNAHLEEQDSQLRTKMDTLHNQHKTELNLVKAEMISMQTSRNQHKTELELIKAGMGSMQTTSNDSTNDIDLLKAEMAFMKREREAFKTDIESLKAEVRSMKDSRAEPPTKIEATPPLLSIHLRQYKKFVTETNQRLAEITEKRKDDDDTAGTELDQLRSKQKEIASTVQDLQKAREERSSLPPRPPCLSVADATLLSNAAACGAQIENMERNLALNSKRLDTEATSVRQATDLSNSAKQLSEANQHSIKSLNARYNNLSTEQLARHVARVLQPLPASIQADHTVLQRSNAELSNKVDGIQRKIDETHTQLQEVRSLVSTLEKRDHGASAHGNAASQELKQEVQRMKGDIDECHSRQDLILGIITDGNVFDEDGKVSAELVTREHVSRFVKASILQNVEDRFGTIRKELYEDYNVNFTTAVQDAFRVLMEPKNAQLTEHIEECVKSTVQAKVDSVSVQFTEQVDASVSRAINEGSYPTTAQLKAHEARLLGLQKALQGSVESFDRKKGKTKVSGTPSWSDSPARNRDPGAPPHRKTNLSREANMTEHRLDKSNAATMSSSGFQELENEVSTLQTKVDDLGSDLASLNEQVNDLNGRVMLGVFRGDIKSSSETSSSPALGEKAARDQSKPANKSKPVTAEPIDKSRPFRTFPSTATDTETLDTKCSVQLDDGTQCWRNLACKSHNIIAKRAVQGRSKPFDQLKEESLLSKEPAVINTLNTTNAMRNPASTESRQTHNRQPSSDVDSPRVSSTSTTSTRKRHRMWDLPGSDSDHSFTLEVPTTQRPSKRFKET